MMMTRNLINKYSKSACRITVDGKVGSGFFAVFNLPDKKTGITFPCRCIISNETVIKESHLNNELSMKVIFVEGNKRKAVNIKRTAGRNANRTMYIWNAKPTRTNQYGQKDVSSAYDVAIVQVLDGDNIPSNLFIEPDLNTNINLYDKTEVMMVGFPDGVKQKHLSQGQILSHQGSVFYHNCNCKEDGSNGSMIVSYKTGKIVGVHRNIETSGTNSVGYATFLAPLLQEIGVKTYIKKKNNRDFNGNKKGDDLYGLVH